MPIALAAGILALVTALTVIGSACFQAPVTYNQGQGWDGVEYYRMAREMRAGQRVVASAPEVYRVGTPALAALSPLDDLISGFWAINMVGALVSVALLAYYLALVLRSRAISVVITALYVLQWHAPIRFTYFYPTYVDPIGIAFVVASLIASRRIGKDPNARALAVLSAISFVGALFREITICIPVAYAVAGQLDGMQPVRRRLLSILPALAGVLGLVVASRLVTPTGNYSLVGTALQFAYAKSLVSYLHAWFIAFGPILLLVAFQCRQSLSYLREHKQESIALGLFAAIGMFGGTDTERLIFFGMPIVYTLIGVAIQARARPLTTPAFVAVLAVAQLISERVFWTIPDFPSSVAHRMPLLTLVGSTGQYLDLYSFHGLPSIEAVAFAEYLIFAAVMGIWWFRLTHNTPALPVPRPAPAVTDG